MTITFSNGERGEDRETIAVPIEDLAEAFVSDDSFEPLSEARFRSHRILAWIAHHEPEDGFERWTPLPKRKIKALRTEIESLESTT
jgi:hypothetical protein